jgi:hypothetical protein
MQLVQPLDSFMDSEQVDDHRYGVANLWLFQPVRQFFPWSDFGHATHPHSQGYPETAGYFTFG